MKNFEVKKIEQSTGKATVIILLAKTIDEVINWCSENTDDVYSYEPVTVEI